MAMSMISAAAFSAALLLVAGTSARAQETAKIEARPEIVLYANVGFSGPALLLSDATPDIDAGFPLLSARIRAGTWEICTRNDFRGDCLVVSADVRSLKGEMGFFSKVGSVRPIAADSSASVSPTSTTATRTAPASSSLRGLSAEFFPKPERDGAPIPPGENRDAAATAFCASAGWTRAAHVAIDGEVIADVLCVR